MARVQGGLGVNIVSTSWGIMTDKDALLKRSGGEILLSVY
jgi:ribosomal protein S8